MSRRGELRDWTLPELRYELAHQQWQGVSTWGTGSCGHPARGSRVCEKCIAAEIARREATP